MKIAISPCPNDTFAFEGFIQAMQPEVEYLDIAALNALALGAESPDLLKCSCASAPAFLERYRILPCGGAYGEGIGPVVVSQPGVSVPRQVVLPGPITTAHILYRAWRDAQKMGDLSESFLRFDQIPQAVANAAVDWGVIIHESRFTFPALGLVAVEDLGAWWNKTESLPVPLGLVLVRRDLSEQAVQTIQTALARSIGEAYFGGKAPSEFVKQHAQEMSTPVLLAHIEAYVTARTLDLGDAGVQSLERLWNFGRLAFGEAAFPRVLCSNALEDLQSLRTELASGRSVGLDLHK